MCVCPNLLNDPIPLKLKNPASMPYCRFNCSSGDHEIYVVHDWVQNKILYAHKYVFCAVHKYVAMNCILLKPTTKVFTYEYH